MGYGQKGECHLLQAAVSVLPSTVPGDTTGCRGRKGSRDSRSGEQRLLRPDHGVIARLAQYADFTPAQLNEIVSAVLSNNQVHWIAGDEDVHSFLSTAIQGHENQIELGNLSKIQEFLEGNPEQPG